MASPIQIGILDYSGTYHAKEMYSNVNSQINAVKARGKTVNTSIVEINLDENPATEIITAVKSGIKVISMSLDFGSGDYDLMRRVMTALKGYDYILVGKNTTSMPSKDLGQTAATDHFLEVDKMTSSIRSKPAGVDFIESGNYLSNSIATTAGKVAAIWGLNPSWSSAQVLKILNDSTTSLGQIVLNNAVDIAANAGAGKPLDFSKDNLPDPYVEIGYKSLYGSYANNTINGGNENNIIYASNGDDVVYGNGGDDTIYGGNDNDKLNGGEGGDRLYGGIGNDNLHGGIGIDIDYLYGEAGNDTLNGGLGNDFVNGGDGNDTMHGDEGNDSIYGDAGTDLIYAGNGNDQIYGVSGKDTIYGGRGNDLINGGSDADSLYGETGADIFQMSSDNAVDVIRDFKISESDVLDFSAIFASGGDDGGTGPIITQQNIDYFIIATQVNGNTDIRIDLDGQGGATAYKIATLTGVTNFNVDVLFGNGVIIT